MQSFINYILDRCNMPHGFREATRSCLAYAAAELVEELAVLTWKCVPREEVAATFCELHRALVSSLGADLYGRVLDAVSARLENDADADELSERVLRVFLREEGRL